MSILSLNDQFTTLTSRILVSNKSSRGYMRLRLVTFAVFTLFFGVLASSPSRAESASVPGGMIVGGWQFRLAASTPDASAHREAQQWHSATVPSTVQTDLLRNGLITDPFTGAHEAQLQWIGLADWEYQTMLNVDAT